MSTLLNFLFDIEEPFIHVLNIYRCVIQGVVVALLLSLRVSQIDGLSGQKHEYDYFFICNTFRFCVCNHGIVSDGHENCRGLGRKKAA